MKTQPTACCDVEIKYNTFRNNILAINFNSFYVNAAVSRVKVNYNNFISNNENIRNSNAMNQDLVQFNYFHSPNNITTLQYIASTIYDKCDGDGSKGLITFWPWVDQPINGTKTGILKTFNFINCTSFYNATISSFTFSPSMYPTYSPTISTFNPTWNPTKTPTISTLNPTINPSKQPTEQPTVDPSAAPTFNPLYPPSVSPTIPPSTAPTNSPTIAPSVAPTNSPLDFSELLDEYITNENDIYTIIIYITIAIIPCLIIIFGFVCTWFGVARRFECIASAQTVDDQYYMAIILYFIQLFDVYSDGIFVAELYGYYVFAAVQQNDVQNTTSKTFYTLFILAMISTLMPYLINFISSIHIVAKITNDANINEFTKLYFRKYGKWYSIFVLLSGG
eukprot:335885_1